MTLCGVVIVLLAGGLQRSLGVFLTPVSEDLDLGREVFGLVIAVQVLVFGCAQPFLGLLADRIGAFLVVALGAIVYSGALFFSSQSDSATHLFVYLGLVMGIGLAGASQIVVLGAVGKVVSNKRRSLVFGTIIASQSLGMFLLVPGVQQGLLDTLGWRDTLVVLAVVLALLPLFAIGLRGDLSPSDATVQQTVGDAITEARSHSGYILLTLGFFVCGFHVTFVATHLPAFLTDNGITSTVAAYALGLVGLVNVIGAYIFGTLGDRYSKKNLLTLIYAGRAILMLGVLVMPFNNITVLVFGAGMGLLWLATVPLTGGLVAQIFGTRYFSMLFGFVFMSHQLGAFFGAWLGGYIYDVTGSYDMMWMLSALYGAAAALLHWPIDEQPMRQEPLRA